MTSSTDGTKIWDMIEIDKSERERMIQRISVGAKSILKVERGLSAVHTQTMRARVTHFYKKPTPIVLLRFLKILGFFNFYFF